MPRDHLLKGHLQGCRLLAHGKVDIQTPMLLKHVLRHAESFIKCAIFLCSFQLQVFSVMINVHLVHKMELL